MHESSSGPPKFFTPALRGWERWRWRRCFGRMVYWPPTAAGVSRSRSLTDPLAPQGAALRAEGEDAASSFSRKARRARSTSSIPSRSCNELHGQKLPESMTQNVRFAFIQKETAVLLGSHRKFTQARPVRHGAVRLPAAPRRRAPTTSPVRSMHTDAFNHHPGQLMMNSGVPPFGRPSMGSWLNYGLGSESQNLPGYVVLTAGRGTSGGVVELDERLSAEHVSGRPVPQPGRAGPEPDNPAGLIDRHAAPEPRCHLAASTAAASKQLHDPEIASRIAATSWPSACSRPRRS